MGLTKEEREALGGSAYDQAYMSDGDLKAAAVFRQKAENGDISWEEANNSVNNIRSTNYGYDGGKDGSEYNYTGGGRKTGSGTGSSSGSGSYSGYGAQINSIANQLMNMNYNQWKQGADYAALKEQYAQNGKMAMQDTVGDVSARTGGLASSYATTAGNQAYNQYMQTLEDAARALYNDEYNRQASNLGVLQSLDNTQYSRYRDAISDRRYDTEWAYKAAQDAISDRRYDTEWKYGVAQDALAQENWQKNFDHTVYQDALQQQNWQKTFDRDGTWHDEDTATSKNDTDYNRALAIAEYTKDFSGMAEFGWTENQIVNANSQANKPTTSGGDKKGTVAKLPGVVGSDAWFQQLYDTYGDDAATMIKYGYSDLGVKAGSVKDLGYAYEEWLKGRESEETTGNGYVPMADLTRQHTPEYKTALAEAKTFLSNGGNESGLYKTLHDKGYTNVLIDLVFSQLGL